MAKNYAYRNLNTSSLDSHQASDTITFSNIRLLELSPGKEGEDIFCSLVHCGLQDGNEYEALSYTWGCPDRTETVKCDGYPLFITKTLREALLTLRSPTKKRILWIDQLCINQEDIEERNSQVKIMHLIYKYAQRTVVFLDSGDVPRREVLRTRDLLLGLRKASRAGENSALKEYKDLFQHSWFQRVWILQEISMSDISKVIVYHRGSALKWMKLTEAATWLGSHDPEHSYDLVKMPPSVRRHKMIMSKWTNICDANTIRFPSVDRYAQMDNRYNKRLYSYFYLWIEPRLTEALQDSRFCLATDPRDKIFSLLNMLHASAAHSKLAWLLNVDYSLSVADVYSRAARFCIESEHSLEVLCYKEGLSTIDGLPSWAPDWTSQRLFPIQRIASPLHYRSQFHNSAPSKWAWLAPRRTKGHKTSVATFTRNGMALSVSGHKLDSIHHVGSIWQATLDTPDAKLFEQWADIYTNGQASELVNMKVDPKAWSNGIETAPLSICDFWLRVGRHTRLMTTDTVKPFHSLHPCQAEWKSSTYHRHRRRRCIMLYRQGYGAFMVYKDWLAMMLPYASIGRRLAASCKGYFLLVPPETKEGDHIYVLEGGGSIGHVLRTREEEEDYEYIGAAYVHGFFGLRMPWDRWTREQVTLR